MWPDPWRLALRPEVFQRLRRQAAVEFINFRINLTAALLARWAGVQNRYVLGG